MKLDSFEVFGEKYYINAENGDIAKDTSALLNSNKVIDINRFLKSFKPTCYTLCLNITNTCNLRCRYCFNTEKSKLHMTSKDAINACEKFFSTFCNADKYFIDFSGKGEPLLNKGLIKEVCDYLKLKSNEIRKEIIPMLVCNGTLLDKENVKFLQSNRILFGVSIDGNKFIHDLNRRDINDCPTFDLIMKNVNDIEDRTYVGCAITLTNNVFSISDEIKRLSNIFNTLSFRLVRDEVLGLSEKYTKLWKIEYEKLTLLMIDEIRNNNIKLFKCLLNGDDLFGRYLFRAFTNSITLNRCDSCITRFTYDIDGKFYGCPASSGLENFAIDENNLLSKSQSELKIQVNKCTNCSFKLLCGGECRIVDNLLTKPNQYNCELKKYLTQLSFYLKDKCMILNLPLFKEILDFCLEKRSRYKVNEALAKFANDHPDLTFTEAKEEFDKLENKY